MPRATAEKPAAAKNGAAKAVLASVSKPTVPVTRLGTAKKKSTFKITAPQASEVSLCGNFNEWQPGRHALKKDAAGVWRTQLTLTPGSYEYRFVVDGEWQDDPDAIERIPNSFGGHNCVRVI